ncbi:MAG: hypothetical protein ACE5JX_18225 [Acidobacteriota bacterium]
MWQKLKDLLKALQKDAELELQLQRNREALERQRRKVKLSSHAKLLNFQRGA